MVQRLTEINMNATKQFVCKIHCGSMSKIAGRSIVEFAKTSCLLNEGSCGTCLLNDGGNGSPDLQIECWEMLGCSAILAVRHSVGTGILSKGFLRSEIC